MIFPEDFDVNLVRMTPDGDLHARRNFDLCRAVDMTALSIVLGDMVKTGHISHRQAEAYKAQAEGLLATLLAENHRSFIGSPSQSTMCTPRRYGIEGQKPSTTPNAA